MGEYSDVIKAIGTVRSQLKDRKGAPRQGYEGAPEVWLEINSAVAEGLLGISVGDEMIVITWLHQSRREVLQVHPRGIRDAPLTGVFATRSPDRPNPVGLHRVSVLEVDGLKLKVSPMEAIDGTPIIDIKPVLSRSADH
jgi:tRNA-Thr(GGU) m(6)t(6)A37 methyltransferase TsaA